MKGIDFGGAAGSLSPDCCSFDTSTTFAVADADETVTPGMAVDFKFGGG